MSNFKKALTAGIAAVAVAGVAGAAQAEMSDGVVKIGVLSDMSGVYADITGPGSVIAAQMAVEDFGGTVNGMPIEVVSADHQNKADIAANVARQWIDEDMVDVVVDVGNSAAALAVQEVTRSKGKVHLNSTAGTTQLTNEECSPTGIHWTYDTFALANGTGTAMTNEGAKKWFFITADYAFGHSLEANTTAAVEAAGGEVVGGVRAPFPNNDFSSFLLQAQGSGADAIALANAGGDFVNAVKQAQEFGITQTGQRLAGMLVFLTDIHALGLETTQGLTITTAWYWDQDEKSREWAERFAERHDGAKPTMVQAGVYSAISHYLKAIDAIDSDEGLAVVDQMKATPVDDMFTTGGTIRADGRHVHDMKLVQVKAPGESEGDWDYYTVLANIPGDQAFMPLSDSKCDLVK
jgi:branched-chain amino acid transport system substrate-binding protein